MAMWRGAEERAAKPSAQPNVGSNPTPATTCENGPLAAETRPGGPFPSCHALYQGVSPWVDARQWLRTYSGQRPGETSGAYNRSLLRSDGGRPWKAPTGRRTVGDLASAGAPRSECEQ